MFSYPRAWLTVLVLATMVAVVTAQENTGSLAGTVRDSSNAVITGATIEILSPALGRTVRVISGTSGDYIAPNLPPGVYAISGSSPGFGTVRVVGLNLLLGKRLKIDLKLQPAPVEQTLRVSDEPPVIDTQSSQTALSLTREVMDNIPTQRSFQNLSALSPSAQLEDKSGGRQSNGLPSGGLQVDGASASENRWFIDGVDTNGLLTGLSGKNLPLEWVQEIQVKSSGFGAEYGGALGGVINAITKSGGNDLHGEVRYYYYGSKLQTNPRPRLRVNPVNARIAEYVRDPKDDETVTDFGFQVAGSVVKDRLLYFVGYQPLLDRTYRDVFFVTPQITRRYNNDQNTQYWTTKLTLQPWEKLRTNFTVTSSGRKEVGVLPSYDGTSNPDAGFERQGTRTPNITYAADGYLRASTNLFFHFRAGYFFTDAHSLGISDQVVYTFAGSPQNYFDQLAPAFRQLSGWASGAPNTGTARSTDTRLTTNADGSWFSHFHGNHDFKFGYQANRLTEDLLAGSLNDSIVIDFDETHANVTLPGVSRGLYGYYYNRFSGFQGKPVSYNHAIYLQDSWQPSSGLTLNIGVRAEHETVPSYRTDNGISSTAIRFPFSSKIAPRAGFAYDLRRDGKSKVYGSFGLYYDMMKYALPFFNFGASQQFYDYYTLDTLDVGSIGRGNYPGKKIETVYTSLPSNAAQPELGGINLIDPHLKPMRAREYTAGYERSLARAWTVDLRYTRRSIDRTIEDVGVSVPGVGTSFFIANPGEGITRKMYGPNCDSSFGGPDCAAFPATPKANRRYDGVEVRLERRFARNWQSVFSYTLSRLSGNYSGLTDSDVVGGFGFGQASPNATSYFDAPYQYVDAKARYIDGPLATDRTQRFKYYGSYRIPLGRQGLTVGGIFSAGSATPTTRTVTVIGAPVFVENRNSDGRLGGFTLTSIYVAHDVKIKERSTLRLDFNLDNAFNQSTALNYVTSYIRFSSIAAGIPGSAIQKNADAVRGFDYKKEIELQANYNRPASCGSFADDPYCPEAVIKLEPQFLKPNIFRGPLAARFGMRLTF